MQPYKFSRYSSLCYKSGGAGGRKSQEPKSVIKVSKADTCDSVILVGLFIFFFYAALYRMVKLNRAKSVAPCWSLASEEKERACAMEVEALG